MKKYAALALSLLLALLAAGCATTGGIAGSRSTAEARLAGQGATLAYLSRHADSASLVLARVAKVQTVLDAGATWEALQAAALSALADPNDAAIIQGVLALWVAPKLPAGGIIAKDSPAGLELQAVLDGAKLQAAIWQQTHGGGGQ